MKLFSKLNTAHEIVEIHGLSFFEGHGVGKTKDGKVLFVDQACPGDILEVQIYKSKKNYAFAKIIKILTASSKRQNAPCDVFSNCGGCTLQHVHYDLQIQEKHKILARYHDKKEKSFDLLPFEPADQKFHYRSRLEVHVKNNLWGFYKKQSHDLVYPKSCWIAHPKINELLNERIENSNFQDGDYHVDLERIQKRTRGDSGVFQQVHSEINTKLKTHLLNAILPLSSEIESIYDLYSGSGNYSLFLSEKFKNLTFHCVELSQTLVHLGQQNSLNKPHVNWIQNDVESFLNSKNFPHPKKSLILINPPRDGLSASLVKKISNSEVQYLIYVSCNPMTLFRDIDALGPNWSIVSLKGFDMFPQTMHFETVAIFKQ